MCIRWAIGVETRTVCAYIQLINFPLLPWKWALWKPTVSHRFDTGWSISFLCLWELSAQPPATLPACRSPAGCLLHKCGCQTQAAVSEVLYSVLNVSGYRGIFNLRNAVCYLVPRYVSKMAGW